MISRDGRVLTMPISRDASRSVSSFALRVRRRSGCAGRAWVAECSVRVRAVRRRRGRFERERRSRCLERDRARDARRRRRAAALPRPAPAPPRSPAPPRRPPPAARNRPPAAPSREDRRAADRDRAAPARPRDRDPLAARSDRPVEHPAHRREVGCRRRRGRPPRTPRGPPPARPSGSRPSSPITRQRRPLARGPVAAICQRRLERQLPVGQRLDRREVLLLRLRTRS